MSMNGGAEKKAQGGGAIETLDGDPILAHRAVLDDVHGVEPQRPISTGPREGSSGSEVAAVEAEVHDGVEAQMLRARVLDGFGWRSFLETETAPGAGETLADAIAPLKAYVGSSDFFREKERALEVISAFVGEAVDDRKMLREITDINVETLYSGRDAIDSHQEDDVAAVRRALFSQLKSDWDSRPFSQVPTFGMGDFDYKLGLRHARYYNLEEESFLDFTDDPSSAKEAIKYMAYSALAERRAIEAERQPNGSSFHRQCLLIEQRAAGLYLSDSHAVGMKYNSPSVHHFGRNAKLESVKSYFDAMISLCVSDSHVVATDVISKDLKMLYEIYGERLKVQFGIDYGEVLRGLKVAVEVSYRLYANLDPGLTRKEMQMPEGEKAWTMLEVVDRSQSKINKGLIEGYDEEDPLVLWSLGSGDGVFERFLEKEKGIRVAGYDVHNKKPDTEGYDPALEYDDARRHFARVYTDDLDPEAEWGAFCAGIDHLRASHGGKPPMILFLGDVLHHLHPAVRFKAWKLLYDEVPSGGYLVIDEPTYCQAADGLSKMYAHPLDSTKHQMVSLEEVMNFMAYLTLRGGEVRACDVNPYAKKNDFYWRLTLTVRKEYPHKDLPFRSPDTIRQIECAQHLLSMTPFRLIEGIEDLPTRAQVVRSLTEAWEWMENAYRKENDITANQVVAMSPDEVRRLFLRWKFNAKDKRGLTNDKLDKVVEDKAPFSQKYLGPILDFVGGDELMEKRLMRAGSILAVLDELVNLGFDVSRKKLREQKNWGGLSPSSTE